MRRVIPEADTWRRMVRTVSPGLRIFFSSRIAASFSFSGLDFVFILIFLLTTPMARDADNLAMVQRAQIDRMNPASVAHVRAVKQREGFDNETAVAMAHLRRAESHRDNSTERRQSVAVNVRSGGEHLVDLLFLSVSRSIAPFALFAR